MISRKSFKKREEELLHELSLLKNANDKAKILIEAYQREVEIFDEIIKNQEKIIKNQEAIISVQEKMIKIAKAKMSKGTD